MNVPRWLLVFFSDFFNGHQIEIIDKNWYRYSQLSISNSSREELLAEARNILSLESAEV